MYQDPALMLSIGVVPFSQVAELLPSFYRTGNTSFNTDLTDESIDNSYADILFQIIRNKPEKTFNFTYVFNNAPSSPYFPSATYERDGFSIGLQPTDLAAECDSLDQWLQRMKDVWHEITDLFADDQAFLGIDSSIAPLFEGDSSLLYHINKWNGGFSQAVLSDMFLTITKFIKQENPRPVGLCGLMVPCLEDFELAREYEQGHFSLERNIFLSLHSGLGVDTYPIGVDEKPEVVVNTLRLVQDLSQKYGKALSVRFVSDGRAKIGDMTDFQNQYLKDVVVRALV
jgi:hypothetical protein